MTLSGLSDSLASVIADAPSFRRRDSSSHVAGGLCVGCLLQSGLDPGEECEPEALVSALSEINLPEQNCASRITRSSKRSAAVAWA